MSLDNDIFIPADYPFQDQGPVFLFSNENVASMFQRLGDISNANILAVTSGGDYAFEAYLAGAKNVDTFDINSFQKAVMELKTHMIKHIDYHDFLSFFFTNSNFFNQDIIAPVRHRFSRELKCFLAQNAAYNPYHETKYPGAFKDSLDTRNLFKHQAPHPDIHPFYNLNYLKTEENYYNLRNLLPDEINFKHCDLINLSEKFNQRYDIILLSNIFDYMFLDSSLPQTRIEQMYHKILVPLARKNLSMDNGLICFQYLWEGNSPAWTSFLDFFERTQSHQKSHTFSARSVNSAYGHDCRDVILTMRQSQKTK